MQAGRLDQRVVIQAPTASRNADYGSPELVWSTLATMWAAVEPLVGREYFAAQEQQSEVSVRVRMRGRSDVTDQCRIVHGAKTYEVVSALAPKSSSTELVLMCKEHR